MIIDDKWMDNITDKKILELMLLILERVKKNPDTWYGICYNFDTHFCDDDVGLEGGNSAYYSYIEKTTSRILETIWAEWPRFSGNLGFPVPSCYGHESPADAYSRANNKWEGKYGQLRKELLDFAITSVKLALKEK